MFVEELQKSLDEAKAANRQLEEDIKEMKEHMKKNNVRNFKSILTVFRVRRLIRR